MLHRIVLFCLGLGMATSLAAQEFGLASYYSDEFHGSRTAYGVIYDRNELTAAHKKHPFGTLLRVTRTDNKKSVIVKVIDKGPFIKGRIVDISYDAARRIGLVEDGVARVRVDVVKRGKGETEKEDAITKKEEKQPPKKTPESYENSRTERLAETKAEARREEPETTERSRGVPTAPSPAPTLPSRLVGKEFDDYGLYRIQILTAPKYGYAVQVASLQDYKNVFRQVADLQAKGFDNVLISIEKGQLGQPVYKVILGAFDSDDTAQRYRKQIKSKYRINGFVVNLSEMNF